MEMKYNSLKEALPSLLEERARLEEEKNRLETIKSELEERHSKIIKELEENWWDISVSRDKLQVLRREDKETTLDNEKALESSNYINLLGKRIMLLGVRDNFNERLGKISVKVFELNKKLGSIIELIKSIEDISILADKCYKIWFEEYLYLFDAAFSDILDTNNLALIFKFSLINNGSLSKENMKALIEKAIKTNIPAYMYLVAVKINNIPDEDMIHLIAAIVASNDKKYIDCLLLDLYKKGVSEEVRNYIASLNISIDMGTMFGYNGDLVAELEQALLEDNLEVLYKHGMYSYEDRAYVLSNIQAGL